jgi:hypothetical protein
LTPASVVALRGAQHAGQTSSAPLVDAVRRATERFRDVDAAIAEGYVQFQGCVSGPEEGAMGVHYSNFALFDDKVDVEHPEALVYEPRNGRLHLVAAEYIAPAEAWDGAHDAFDKPTLMGQLFISQPVPTATDRPLSTSVTSGPGRTTRTARSPTGIRASRARTGVGRHSSRLLS